MLCILFVVTFARDPHAQAERNALDPAFPDFLIELRVKADVFGAHGFGSESFNFLDCFRSAFLEGYAVNTFVEMNGVFSRDNVRESRSTGRFGL